MTSAAGKAERARSKIEGRLASTDPALGRVIDAVIARIGPQRIAPSRTTPFEALVRAIVYQSVSGKAAASIFARLKESGDRKLTPAKILALPPSTLKKAGLSTAKAQSIGNLAVWFTSHRKLASALSTLADDQVIETLTAIPGIGPWTVNVFLIFNLGRLDVVPAADLGIRRGVQLTDGLCSIATPKQVLERSQAWRPYRSIASIYLWQATKLKLGPNDLNRRRTMIVVHHLDDSRSLRILWLLEELRVPYEIKHHKRDPRTRLAPPALKEIHPLGKSPVIEDSGRVIAESGAIIDYLLRHYGGGRLQPSPSTAAYNAYVHWMHYAEGSAMPALIVSINVARVGDAAAAALVRLDEEVALQLSYIDGALEGREYILGTDFSAADIQLSFVGELAAARFGIAGYPNIVGWMKRFQARPAYKAALARGGPYGFAA